jgi:hypothetical protein
MEQSEVHESNFVSNFHYLNEIEFYEEFDLLLSEFEFLLFIEDHHDDIPADTEERYETFIKSAARYYYLINLKKYRNLSLRQVDSNVIKGLLVEIESVTNNPEYKPEHPSYPLHYLKAVEFINKIGTLIYNVFDAARTIKVKYTKNELTVYTYILYTSDYFKKFPVPTYAFDINSIDGPFNFFGEVYGKYILLAELLNEEKGKPTFSDETPAPIKNSSITEIISNKLGWTFKKLINPTYEGNFKVLMETLKAKNPIAEALIHSGLSRAAISQQDLFNSKAMRIFHSPVINDFDGERISVIDRRGRKTFFQELFTYLIEKQWIITENNPMTDIYAAIQSNLTDFSAESTQYLIDRSSIKRNTSELKQPMKFREFIEVLTKTPVVR